MTKLDFEVFTNVWQNSVPGIPSGTESLNWLANTSTLVYGEHDAVLVDTFMTKDAIEGLANQIQDLNVNLKYIYITHPHQDHFLGAGMLKQFFPAAKIISTRETQAGIPDLITPERLALGNQLFGNQMPSNVVGVEQYIDSEFAIEDHVFKVIEDGKTDTDFSTSLWVPDLKLIIAGDATYNGIHPHLSETTAESRQNWIKANQVMKNLNPSHVIAGHKVPDNVDGPTILDETIQYIDTFDKQLSQSSSAPDLYNKMLERYPNLVNPGSLWESANALFK